MSLIVRSVRRPGQQLMGWSDFCSAYPEAALFAACDPEKPCITPGTYAFLGAAAALA